MDNKVNHRIVGIGEDLWDILPDGKKLGGAPANFVYNVSQFGFPSLVISAVGDDTLGREATALLERRGVDSMLARMPYPTGTVDVSLDGSGVPVYDIKRDVAWDFIPMGKALHNLAHEATVVCFGTLAQRNPVSRATINMFLDTMPDGKGRIKVFDINLRQGFFDKEVVEQFFLRCNILKINDEELVVVNRMLGYGGLELEHSVSRLRAEYNLDSLILTCGRNGSYIFSKEGKSFIPTPEVKVADTVGAGDSFTAAFIAGILKGMPVRDAHRLAVDVSAYVCTCDGAMNELPPRLLGI